MIDNESVDDARRAIYESLLYQLRELKEDDSTEIYFHDTISEEVDDTVSRNDRDANLEIIDDTGYENDIDEGLVDRTADITRQIAQIAYGCLEQELFNDDFMQHLQELLNNETIDFDTAQDIIKELEDELGNN